MATSRDGEDSLCPTHGTNRRCGTLNEGWDTDRRQLPIMTHLMKLPATIPAPHREQALGSPITIFKLT